MPIVHAFEAYTEAMFIAVFRHIVQVGEASQTPMPSGHLALGITFAMLMLT
jgi:hypothetical protein